MDVKKYIESGILELYVAGALSAEENAKVYEMLTKHPEILKEVEGIETTVSKLTSSVAPNENEASFKNILIKLLEEQKVISIDKPKTNWVKYSGWAASVLVGTTLIFSVLNNVNLNEKLEITSSEKQQFEQQLEASKSSLKANKELLGAIRAKGIITVPLQGQTVSPESYAKVYWNKEDNTIYLDVQGLPDPPAGKVYQLWSLKLNPLTPTSLGTIDDFIADENKIFAINNPNESQAFGITLEPAGGSKSPTLEQLYTLGAVSP